MPLLMELCWCETLLSEEEFKAARQDADFWQDLDGDAAYENARDFLALAKTTCPTVVVLQEGYQKLQPLALNLQLPLQMRAAASLGWQKLPPPEQLHWRPCPNLLHPQQLLCRELTGRVGACPLHEPPLKQLDSVPFASVERCKLLDVQCVCKELYQHEPRQQGLQQQAPQQQGLQQQQQQAPTVVQERQDGLQILEHERVWGDSTAVADPVQQQRPLCKRLSMRVVLQRLPAAPLSDEAADAQLEGTESQADSNWQQRGLQGCGQVQQVAYTCTLEYPAFNIQSSDYLVDAAAFDSGLSIWQALHVGDAFSMLWDNQPFPGAVQGYRQRKPDDPFFGSPFWSIAVKWDGNDQEPKLQPEDWRYGNPWEMTRKQGTAPPPLYDPRHAAAAKASRGVQIAPWTAAAAAIAAEATKRTQAKRKRQRQAYHDDHFVYESHELSAADDAAPGDVWDPAEFYYDDDPEDFEADLELDTAIQPRRKSARRQDRQQRRSRRYAMHAADTGGIDSSSRPHRVSAAAPGELTHNYGRDVLVCTDACMVCSSQEGTLITGHAGRSGGNCTRRYHAGCLLLLNAAGIRCVTLAKQAAQQQKRGQAGSGRAGAAAASQQAVADQADALYDGLLGTLWRLQQQQQSLQQEQLQQQQSLQLSTAVTSAITAAQQAALRVASGELVLICPSHGCHGCMLNGKQECMVWCCCCWVRAYHHRQCVPHGAEFVQVDGRSFIRCPHCRAAGVPLPGNTSETAAGAAAGAAPAGRAEDTAAAETTAEAAAAGQQSSGTGQGCCGGSSSCTPADHTAMPAVDDADAAVEQPAANIAAAAGAPHHPAAAATASPEPQQTPLGGSVELAELQFTGLHTAGTGHGCSTSSNTHAPTQMAAMQSTADAVPPAGSPAPQQQQVMDCLQVTSAAAAAAAGASSPSASVSLAPTQPLGSASHAPTAFDNVSPTEPLSSAVDQGEGVDLLDSSDQEFGLQASEHGVPGAPVSDVTMIDISDEAEQEQQLLHARQRCTQQQQQQQEQQQHQDGVSKEPDVIMIDCSDDAEQEPQQQEQQHTQQQQEEHRQEQHLQEQQNAQQQQQEHQQPEQQREQQCHQEQQQAMHVQQVAVVQRTGTSGCTGVAGGRAPGTADAGVTNAVGPPVVDAEAGTSDQANAVAGDEDLALLAMVAQLDAQLLALQHPVKRQNQQGQQQHDQQQQDQQQHGQQRVASESGQLQEQQEPPEAPEQSAGAVQGAAAALRPSGSPAAGNGPASAHACRMPAWLRLAIEDTERTQPSYMLVPYEAPGSGNSSSGAAAQAAAVLAVTAAAAGTLPQQPAGNAAVAGGKSAEGFGRLPLSSPHTHWLMGSMAKAEDFFKPANVWGCAIIGVPSCSDDSVYGLAVVLDFLPALQQRQQQLSTLAQHLASLQASASGATVKAGAVGVDPAFEATTALSVGRWGQANAVAGVGGSCTDRARPLVYLKCNKSVAKSGRVQPEWQARDDTERRVQDWQVLVNGNVYPVHQGRELQLQEGDVIVVQGLSLKLQLSQ